MRFIQSLLISLVALVAISASAVWFIRQGDQGLGLTPTPHVVTETLSLDRLALVSQVTAADDINDLEVSPNEKTLYAPSSDEDLVYLIDTVGNTVDATFEIKAPWAVALSPTQSRLYVTQGTNQLSAISPQTGQVLQTAPTGRKPIAVELTPDGEKVIVVNNLSNNLNFFSAHTLELIASAPVGRQPRSLAIVPELGNVYVTNYDDSSVSVVSLENYQETARINFYGRPNQILYHPIKKLLYVTDSFSNLILIIDPYRSEVVGQINTSRFPYGLALGRTDEELLVTSFEQNSLSLINLDQARQEKTLRVEQGFTSQSGFTQLVYLRSQNKLLVANILNGQVLVFTL